MTNNRIVGAGFELPPLPAPKCEPDQACTPVGGAVEYTVKVQGKGAVVAPKTGSLTGKTCETSRSTGVSCSLLRYKETDVRLTAIAKYGGQFRGWGGDCGGTGKCSFYSKRYDSRREITATFR